MGLNKKGGGGSCLAPKKKGGGGSCLGLNKKGGGGGSCLASKKKGGASPPVTSGGKRPEGLRLKTWRAWILRRSISRLACSRS